MKKLLLGSILLALAIVVPLSVRAEVNISIGFPLPPPVVFSAPPEVIVVPDAYDVYAVPDVDVDIFFWNGWWWRPWGGRWYRSNYYDRGWAYYANVPSFYYDVDPGWRGYYRDRHWHGHRWDYERVPYQRLHSNWRNWKTNRYWERQRTWGVQSYRPRPQYQRQELRRQRQEEYRKRPEVERHRQERKEYQRHQRQQPDYQRQQHERQPQRQRDRHDQQQQRQSGDQERQRNHQPQQQRSEPRGQQHQGKGSDRQSHGKHERWDEEPRR